MLSKLPLKQDRKKSVLVPVAVEVELAVLVEVS